MGRSTQGLVRLIKLGFLDFLPTLFLALSALTIVFLKESVLAGVMTVVIPVGLYIVFRQISSQKGIRVSLLREKEKIDGTAIELLGGVETIRASDTSDFEVSRINKIAGRLRFIEMKHHVAMALYDAAKYLNEAFFYVLVVSVSIYLATTGMISTGDILTYSILFTSVLTPLRSIHRILDEAHESAIKVKDLHDLLQQEKDVAYFDSAVETKDSMEAIRIEDLSFVFAGTTLLNSVTLSIRSGEKIGVVGASGCGKSTLVKLLLRLHHGYEGKITFLGTDLQAYSRSELAKHIAYVPQQPYIFAGTVRDNLIYGNESALDEFTLRSILEAVQLKAELQAKGGLDTELTEGGKNISGGQRQRLAIARALLRKPAVLILDEATAALDNANEATVQKLIEEQNAKTTVITIAHRLSTLVNADRILVFSEGSIVQEGSYAELEVAEGPFKTFLESTTIRWWIFNISTRMPI